MDWLGRVEGIRRWSRGGERAAHKPLLLLYVLGRLQRDGPAGLRFVDVEQDVSALLTEFGPPRTTSPGYPFHHLTNDGLWIVRTAAGAGSPGSGLGALRSANAVGELEPRFAAALTADPQLFAQVVRVLLDANFAPSLHPDICAAVGLDVEAAELAGGSASALRTRTRRSPSFRTEVLIAYEYRCAFCGFDGFLGGTAVGLDAAHVRWWAYDGPDDIANALCLCALHHKLFDKGVLGLSDDRTVTVSTRFVGRSPAATTTVLDLVGRPMLPPQAGYPAPEAAHVEWHVREVFKAPARAVPTASGHSPE